MRGYHIRITLVSTNSAPGPSSAATSTSYKHTPSISVSSSSSSSPFIPSSLFQPLPSHTPQYAARRNTLSVYSAPEKDKSPGQRARRDCRLGTIRVDWVDFSDMDVPGAAFIKVGSGKERDRSAQKKGVYAALLLMDTLNPNILRLRRTGDRDLCPPHACAQQVRHD